MTRQKLLTGLATLAVICGVSSTAMADPFADEALALTRVTKGTTSTGTPINTSWDNGDNGIDAVGAPNLSPDLLKPALTILGFDARQTADPADDVGGTLALRFLDNICVDGSGPDIKVHESGSDETAMIEVSDDGGRSFVMVGHIGPDNGYELDVDGRAKRFTQVRLTAKSHAGSSNTAGIDVDAIECLNSDVPGAQVVVAPDGCDLVGGFTGYRYHGKSKKKKRAFRDFDSGADVRDVNAESDGLSVSVALDLCGPVSSKVKYLVHLDYMDETNLDGDDVDDGPDTLDGNPTCERTADHTAAYHRGKQKGGVFYVEENRLVLELNYTDMGLDVGPGAKVLIWVETKGRGGISDRVPTTEAGDRCGRPQLAKEVFEITLQDIPE